MKDSEIKLIPCKRVPVNKFEEKLPINIEHVGTKTKWEQGFTGEGVVIALLDTGCNVQHPDLYGRIIGGYNFTQENDGNIANFEDTNGHGTHTAGIIAGSRNGQGIVGIAPNSELLILKVLNQYGGGSIKDLIEAIHYAIDWNGPAGEKVRVISLSLGTENSHEGLYKAIKRAVENDIPVVVASGNNGDGNIATNEYRYPGAYEEVIEVGAIDGKNNIAYFSNTNEFIDLYAPGVDIYSTYLKDKFAVLSGTSMAVPHVAGSIALLIEEYEKRFKRLINEKEIYQILMSHTLFDHLNKIRILDLSEKEDICNQDYNVPRKNREMLIKCFCEARKTQAYFTKCLDLESSDEERDFLLELVKESANTSKKIKEFCEKC